jgi:hypothetical protein
MRILNACALGLVICVASIGQPSKAAAPAKAEQAKRDDCDTYHDHRTLLTGVRNTSNVWGIEVGFCYLTARDAAVWGPYEKTTGPVTVCQNLGPGMDCIKDPCRAQLNPGHPIQAAVAEAAIKFVKLGQSYDWKQTDTAPEGKHWVNAVWTISFAKDRKGKERPVAKFTGSALRQVGR